MGVQLRTEAGKWRHCEDDWSRPPEEPLTVVGQGLGRAKLWTPGGQDDKGPPGSHTTKVKRVPFPVGPPRAGNRAAGEPAARARPAAEEVKRLRAGRAGTRAGCERRSCWVPPRAAETSPEKLEKPSALGRRFRVSPAPDRRALSLAVSAKVHRDFGEERLDAEFVKLAEDSSNSLQPDLSFINNFRKPEKLAKAEKRFKEEAVVEMMKLDKQIKKPQIRLEPLAEETRQLLGKNVRVEEENQFFLEYLTKQTKESRQRTEKLWNYYSQQSGQIEQRRRELTSKHAGKNSALKTELLQKEKIVCNLNKQLEAMRDVSIVKEKQEREIQTLQQEIKKTLAETAAKKRAMLVQFVQGKALLEAQLSELDARQLGKRPTKQLKSKNEALERAAKQYTSLFHSSIDRQHQQLQNKLPQLIQKGQKLEATHSRLKKQQQQLQQDQWYLECLSWGRQRLHERRNPCPKGQGAPKTILNPALGTKSRTHPK
ncbi:coiled-coil domain-containing protein 121 [Mesoplodon densirostris]|uniref:coiled-coil domain-containing protein 121 n=1 Tax=Mesoplodon densirostris TaxID=48708 RepID=UPI0028DCFA24|nr:coiled-coil domain-containing protein 121 [Mesoplodon densirostris]